MHLIQRLIHYPNPFRQHILVKYLYRSYIHVVSIV
nr:MAG TPA: hypothetical protein [Caudoviricetes sp.]